MFFSVPDIGIDNIWAVEKKSKKITDSHSLHPNKHDIMPIFQMLPQHLGFLFMKCERVTAFRYHHFHSCIVITFVGIGKKQVYALIGFLKNTVAVSFKSCAFPATLSTTISTPTGTVSSFSCGDRDQTPRTPLAPLLKALAR